MPSFDSTLTKKIGLPIGHQKWRCTKIVSCYWICAKIEEKKSFCGWWCLSNTLVNISVLKSGPNPGMPESGDIFSSSDGFLSGLGPKFRTLVRNFPAFFRRHVFGIFGISFVWHIETFSLHILSCTILLVYVVFLSKKRSHHCWKWCFVVVVRLLFFLICRQFVIFEPSTYSCTTFQFRSLYKYKSNISNLTKLTRHRSSLCYLDLVVEILVYFLTENTSINNERTNVCEWLVFRGFIVIVLALPRRVV